MSYSISPISLIFLDPYGTIKARLHIYKYIQIALFSKEMKDSTIVLILLATYISLGIILVIVACEKINRLCIF